MDEFICIIHCDIGVYTIIPTNIRYVVYKMRYYIYIAIFIIVVVYYYRKSHNTSNAEDKREMNEDIQQLVDSIFDKQQLHSVYGNIIAYGGKPQLIDDVSSNEITTYALYPGSQDVGQMYEYIQTDKANTADTCDMTHLEVQGELPEFLTHYGKVFMLQYVNENNVGIFVRSNQPLDMQKKLVYKYLHTL